MLFFVWYKCGCREDCIGDAIPRTWLRCPMHGDRAVRALTASIKALELAYGKDVSWQPAFYPRIDGAKDSVAA